MVNKKYLSTDFSTFSMEGMSKGGEDKYAEDL